MYRKETIEAINRNIIAYYNAVMKVMEHSAKEHDESNTRAYGGVIRATKGQLQEFITHQLIEITWINELKQEAERLEINSKKIAIPMQSDYLNKLPNEVQLFIRNNIDKYVYKLSVDKHVFIDKSFVAGIECKAYTENAMLKRILVDFMLLKTKYSDLECYLFQLESMLGGDYSELNPVTFGSTSSHSIMSYFDNVDLNIFTFIKGERDVDRPINKYFKELEINSLENAVGHLCSVLGKYAK